MTFVKRKRWIAGLVVVALLGSLGTLATVTASGGLSEGNDLLAEAGITIEEAKAAAQAVRPGNVTEIELERENGRLVFEVLIEDQEVTVDVANGEVLGFEVETGSEDGSSDDGSGDDGSGEDDDGTDGSSDAEALRWPRYSFVERASQG